MDLYISSSTSFDVLGIIKTVSASISEVFLLCLVGYVLSLKGVIDFKSKATLNTINVSFFTPALLFSKVAFSLTYEKLADLYIVPVSFAIITLSSLAIGWLLATACRLRRAERNFCLSFAMFMNSNSLPIALMTSLIHGLHGQSGLNWGSDDSADKQVGRSLSYLVVFSTLGLVLRWSFGVGLLSASMGDDADLLCPGERTEQDRGIKPSEEAVGSLGSSSSDESSPLLRQRACESSESAPISSPTTPASPYSERGGPHLSSQSSLPLDSPSSPSRFRSTDGGDPVVAQTLPDPDQSTPHDSKENQQILGPAITGAASASGGRVLRPIFHSFPNLRAQWAQSIASSRYSVASGYESECSASVSHQQPGLDSEAEGPELGAHRQTRRRKLSSTQRIGKLWRKVVVRPLLRIRQFMTPPLYAALLSLVVVCLPGLQKWLDELKPLRSALKSAGNVSVPLTLVVLGAYFNNDKPKPEAQSEGSVNDFSALSLLPQSKAAQQRQRERRTIFASILARQILTPLILTPILFFTLRYLHDHKNGSKSNPATGKFHEDPCFIVVVVLLIGAPPAITLAQMTSTNPFPAGSSAYLIQAKQNLQFERLVSKTLLVSYALITPPTTIALVVVGLLIEANR